MDAMLKPTHGGDAAPAFSPNPTSFYAGWLEARAKCERARSEAMAESNDSVLERLEGLRESFARRFLAMPPAGLGAILDKLENRWLVRGPRRRDRA